MTFISLAPHLEAMLQAGRTDPFWQSLAIIVASLILEDIAGVLTAMAAADGRVSVGLALSSLYIGLAVGDIGLYWLGRLAASYSWARRYASGKIACKLRRRMGGSFVGLIIAARFLPGTRLPTYTACGFLSLPFGRFAAAVASATLVWVVLLFGVSYAFGNLTARALGVWRWPIGLTLAVLALLWARLVMRRHSSDGGDL